VPNVCATEKIGLQIQNCATLLLKFWKTNDEMIKLVALRANGDKNHLWKFWKNVKLSRK